MSDDTDQYDSSLEVHVFGRSWLCVPRDSGDKPYTILHLDNRRRRGYIIVLNGLHRIRYGTLIRHTEYPGPTGKIVSLVRVVNRDGSLGEILTDRRPTLPGTRYRLVQHIPGCINPESLLEGTADELSNPAYAWIWDVANNPSNGPWWIEQQNPDTEVWTRCHDPRIGSAA